MPRCPVCRRIIYSQKYLFFTNNTTMQCPKCNSTLRIKKNYYLNVVIWIGGMVIGRWLFASSFSLPSIIAFIVITCIIILIPYDTLYFEETKKL